MKKKALVFTICGLLIFTGCVKSPKLSDGKQVVASIDGKTVTAEDLYDSMKDQYGTSSLIALLDEYIIKTEIPDDKDYEEQANIQIKQYKINYKIKGNPLISLVIPNMDHIKILWLLK